MRGQGSVIGKMPKMDTDQHRKEADFSKITAPVLTYFGGKWRIAKWIISQFLKLSAKVALSAYPHLEYEQALKGWRKSQRAIYTQGRSGPTANRTEVLWMNYAAPA